MLEMEASYAFYTLLTYTPIFLYPFAAIDRMTYIGSYSPVVVDAI